MLLMLYALAIAAVVGAWFTTLEHPPHRPPSGTARFLQFYFYNAIYKPLTLPVSAECRNLLATCLQGRHEVRPSAADALLSCWQKLAWLV